MTKIKASDRDCIKCGQQAVAFYPVIDLDIRSHPYCRTCLDKTKLEFLISMYEDERAQKDKGANKKP